MQNWSVSPCVRPFSAAHMTARDNALRGSGPGHELAFDNAVAQMGCPDRWIDRLALRAVRPPNLHITPDVAASGTDPAPRSLVAPAAASLTLPRSSRGQGITASDSKEIAKTICKKTEKSVHRARPNGCCSRLARYWSRQCLEQNCLYANRCRIRPKPPLQTSQRGFGGLPLCCASLLVISTSSIGNAGLSSEEADEPLKSEGSKPPKSRYKEDHPSHGGD